jgi:hypothetical protein
MARVGRDKARTTDVTTRVDHICQRRVYIVWINNYNWRPQDSTQEAQREGGVIINCIKDTRQEASQAAQDNGPPREEGSAQRSQGRHDCRNPGHHACQSHSHSRGVRMVLCTVGRGVEYGDCTRGVFRCPLGSRRWSRRVACAPLSWTRACWFHLVPLFRCKKAFVET